jgi:hypothetical protein
MTEHVLKPEDMDRLGAALITLTREIWVLKDRQRILEAVLEDAGVLDHSRIDSYAPDDGLSEALKTERQQLIDSVLESMAPSSSGNK